MRFRFNNPYRQLGERFYQRIEPTPVPAPGLIVFNDALAAELGIESDGEDNDALARLFSGNRLPVGAEPLAMAYSGHQFGHFNPGLGDGRALLIGQIETPGGAGFDIQLKGSGRTRYSRDGDGRSALGPVIREYLLSEAMHALAIPTTRALAAVTTGEQVAREALKPGGIITRVSNSFVRVGSFQHFAHRDDADAVRTLADYCIARSYPELEQQDDRYRAFLDAVIERQAGLIAAWMHIGFIHGVMNTDNMSIAGETIDYGPCAFMDGYLHDKVYSSIDRQGRYAYNQQPNIGMWNLTRLAECLLPLLAEDESEAVEIAKHSLEGYVGAYQQHWIDGMRRKLGLATARQSDKELIESLFDEMARNDADFTLTFLELSSLQVTASEQDGALRRLFNTTAGIDSWLQRWRDRLRTENADDAGRQAAMRKVNPVYIPRNHQVEAAIRAAEDEADFSVMLQLLEVLQRPFERQPGRDGYMLPPRPEEIVQRTFCGT